MHKNNLQSIKLAILTKISNDLIENKNINESKKLMNDLILMIRESKVLTTINLIFENINNKEIINESLATKYLDGNFSLLNEFSSKEVNEALNLLESKFTNNIEPINNEINNSINFLIKNHFKTTTNKTLEENLNSYDKLVKVLTEEKNNDNVKSFENINEDVLNIANNLHGETINSLNESDKILYDEIIGSENIEEYYETYKSNIVDLLENIKDDTNNVKINSTKLKINEMKYNKENYVSDLIKLDKLKENLKEG